MLTCENKDQAPENQKPHQKRPVRREVMVCWIITAKKFLDLIFLEKFCKLLVY